MVHAGIWYIGFIGVIGFNRVYRVYCSGFRAFLCGIYFGSEGVHIDIHSRAHVYTT